MANASTNKKQFKCLVDFMCENPEIGRGLNRKLPQTKQMMQELFAQLNNLGPPQKPENIWRKVWADYRHSTKKKFREHSSNLKMHNFSDLEHRVINLLQLEQQFDLVNEEWVMQQNQQRHARKRTISNCNREADFDEFDNFTTLELEVTNFSNHSDTDENTDKEKIKKFETTDIDNLLICTEIPSTSKAIKQNENTTVKNTTTINGRTTAEEEEKERKDTTMPQFRSACNPLKIKKHINSSNNNQQNAMLRVLQKIEQQMIQLNQTEERHADLLEENNKLLKLLIYRSTIAKTDD